MTEKELCDAFLTYLKDVLHFVDAPSGFEKLTYIPNNSESNNDLCMVFDDNYKIVDMVRLYSDAPVDFDKEDFFRATHYSDDCRFIQIKGKTYDLYNPQDIAKIPIPAIDFTHFDERDIPEWFEEKVGYNHVSSYYPDPDSDPRNDDFAEFWNGEGYFEKAEEMIDSKGKVMTVKVFTDLAVEFAKSNNLDYPREEIEEYISDWIDIIEEDMECDNELDSEDMPSEWADDLDEDDFKVLFSTDDEDFGEEDTLGNELGSLLEHRLIGCFEPAILLPMSYIAVNLSISEKSLDNLERVVAQLVANNEDEYGKYLADQLSPMCGVRYDPWSYEDSIEYGNNLKDWAINTREYIWIKDNFPEEAPKTKGAYTTAKRKQTKRYFELKQLAESKGYKLNDDT